MPRGLRNLLIVSGVVAGISVFVSLVLPSLLVHFHRSPDFPSMTISVWCAIVCIGLFVAGVAWFRFRGLWLAIPMAVTLLVPVVVIWSAAAGLAQLLDSCQKAANCH
jgi:hypothetical protein